MNTDIVGVGCCTVDVLGLAPRIPGVDEVTRLERIEMQGGGMVSQALVAASRLGKNTAYIGNLGDDNNGRFLKADFVREGVDVSCLRLEEGRHSPFSFIGVDKSSGKRTIYAFPGTMTDVSFTETEQAIISGAGILHLDGINYDVAVEAARIAKAAGTRISLDGCRIENDKEKTLSLVRVTDVLIANETFARELTGIDEPQAALLELGRLGVGIVVSTAGSKGVTLVRDGDVKVFGAFAIEALDTTGAGDVFHGAFLFGLLESWNLHEAIRFASAAAALNCLNFGGRSGIPKKTEIINFMENRRPTFYENTATLR